MPPYIQNIVFDNYPGYRDTYYVDDDEVVGLGLRKKSIAGNIWECLTGKKKKPGLILLNDDYPRPRQDFLLNEQRCYTEDFTLNRPPLCRYHSYSPWRHRYHEQELECQDCVCCCYDWTFGDHQRPHRHRTRSSSKRRRRTWDYYEHGEEWDTVLFWEPNWIPPRHRRHGRLTWQRRRHETVDQTMRWEMIKLMRDRLNESRHERIYGTWPTGYSPDNSRRRNDRIRELEDKIDRLRRWQERADGSEDGDYHTSDSDD